MMTKDEVIAALDKSGIDYEFISEDSESMRIKVDFEPEDDGSLEEYTTPKFEVQPVTYECPVCGFDDLPEDDSKCPKCKWENAKDYWLK
jgi:rubrerythrin